MRAKHKAVAGIAVYGAELVKLMLRQVAEHRFTISLTLHIPQISPCLVLQHFFAKGIKLALSIVAGDSFHHFHPLSVGGLGGSLPFRYY